MATYISLLTLTPEGRERALQEPQSVLRAQAATSFRGIQVLGIYAVLGDYDFVNIVEADDNEAIARFSLELGVRAGAHIATLPVIPISRLEATDREETPGLESEVTLTPPTEL